MRVSCSAWGYLGLRRTDLAKRSILGIALGFIILLGFLAGSYGMFLSMEWINCRVISFCPRLIFLLFVVVAVLGVVGGLIILCHRPIPF